MLKLFCLGLGFWCEQAFESCHHDFKVYSFNLNWFISFYTFQVEWEKVKVDPSHPEFGERLKAAISAYNAKHI